MKRDVVGSVITSAVADGAPLDKDAVERLKAVCLALKTLLKA